MNAAEVVDHLRRRRIVLALAESCTGGAVAATLTAVPGVSDVFAGSFVTYRDDSKRRWVGVDAEAIEAETSVSASVAHMMARGALRQTPEATKAISITGHLGPNAPAEQDGVAFIGIARGGNKVDVRRIEFNAKERSKRREEAVAVMLETIAEL